MDPDDDESDVALVVTKKFSVKVPSATNSSREGPVRVAGVSSKSKPPNVTVIAFCATKKRLYYGLDNGDLCFWTITMEVAKTSCFVGSHKGAVSAICIPSEGPLAAANLLLSGSVDGSIKVWDYQGRLQRDPSVLVQTLYAHSGTVTAIFVYGDHVLSGSTDKAIKAWKSVEGRGYLAYPWYDLQATIATLDGWVRSMSYDKTEQVGDHGTFLAVDEAGSIVKIVPERVYDEDGKKGIKSQVFTLDGRQGLAASHTVPGGLPVIIRAKHDCGVFLVHLVAEWQMVFTASYDNCLRVYDLKSGAVKFEWENESRCNFSALETDVEFGEALAVDHLGHLSIFSVRNGQLQATKQLAKESILSIKHVLGRQMYAVATAREVSVWLIEHDLDFNVLRGGHEKAVINIYTCTGGTGAPSGEQDHRIFSASLDNTVRLWDPYDMAVIRVLQEERSEISAMTFYEAWNILVTGHDNGDIRLWDLDTGSNQTLRQHTNSVTSLVMALLRRNEELLLSASYDGMVILWDIRSLRNEPPYMVAKFRAHGGADPGLGLKTAQVSATKSLTDSVGALDLSWSGSASKNGSMHSAPSLNVSMRSQTHSDVGTGSARPLPASDPEVLCVKYCPVKKVIISGGNDLVIKVWSASGYFYKGQHLGHSSAVTCLTLDANFLFSGSDDCTICLWDTVPTQADLTSPDRHGFTTRPLKVLEGHTRSVTGLEVVSSSGKLASVSLDGTLRFWDYITGCTLKKFEHHEEFRCLALRLDRDEVLVGTMQASILRFSTKDNPKEAEVAGEEALHADDVIIAGAEMSIPPSPVRSTHQRATGGAGSRGSTADTSSTRKGGHSMADTGSTRKVARSRGSTAESKGGKGGRPLSASLVAAAAEAGLELNEADAYMQHSGSDRSAHSDVDD